MVKSKAKFMYSYNDFIISNCRMQVVSVLDYFKRFFSEIVKGRRDYEHLLPLTIGLN